MFLEACLGATLRPGSRERTLTSIVLLEWDEKSARLDCSLHVTCQVSIGHAKVDASFRRPRRAWGMWGRLDEGQEHVT